MAKKFVIVSDAHYATESNGHSRLVDKEWYTGSTNFPFSTMRAKVFSTKAAAEAEMATLSGEHLKVEAAPHW